jgi:hypothetical protein
VLNAVNDFGVTLNAGKNKGIAKNMYFEISTPPQNGSEETQGKGIVKITETYETFSTAERFDENKSGLPFAVGDDASQIVAQVNVKKQEEQFEYDFHV